MKPDQAAKVLRNHSASVDLLPTVAAAIDAAVAALEVAASAKPAIYVRVSYDFGVEEVCSTTDELLPVGEHRYYAAPQPAYCCAKCGLAEMKGSE